MSIPKVSSWTAAVLLKPVKFTLLPNKARTTTTREINTSCRNNIKHSSWTTHDMNWDPYDRPSRREDEAMLTRLPSGWRINGLDYPRNAVITRPRGYVPFQSVGSNDPRHGYQPGGLVPYPRGGTLPSNFEARSQIREDRRRAWELVRPSTSVLPRGATMEFEVRDRVGYSPAYSAGRRYHRRR